MGARQSKAAEFVGKSIAAKLKTPAKTPISQKTIQNLARQKVEGAFVHQRQIEQEFERQQVKPKPAPIRTSVTGSPDRINMLSADEKVKRTKEAEDVINDRELFERLSKVSTLTENIESYRFEGQAESLKERLGKNEDEHKRLRNRKILKNEQNKRNAGNTDNFQSYKSQVSGDSTFHADSTGREEEHLNDTNTNFNQKRDSDSKKSSDPDFEASSHNYNEQHKFHQKITGEQDFAQATYVNKNQRKVKGRVASHEQINIISNHKTDPVNWNAPEIAKLLNMRENDVTNIIKYYRLIDDDEVDHIEPPNMEWSQRDKCWMVGEPLPDNPTLEDLKENWTSRKPMISAGRLKKMKEMHKRADPKYNFGAVKALNEVYYIPPKVYEELLLPLKPEDKMFLTGAPISKDSLGVGAGEVPLHEKIRQIEAMGEVEMPKFGEFESEKKSELGSGESGITPMNVLTPEKRAILDGLKKKDDEKPKGRFNDDASY
jgi:hypothetical protein